MTEPVATSFKMPDPQAAVLGRPAIQPDIGAMVLGGPSGWLAQLKPGDHVTVCKYWTGDDSVVRIPKTVWFVNQNRVFVQIVSGFQTYTPFDRRSGRQIGCEEAWLEPPTVSHWSV